MFILLCLLLLDDDDTASSSGASDTEVSKVHEDDILIKRFQILFLMQSFLSVVVQKK